MTLLLLLLDFELQLAEGHAYAQVPRRGARQTQTAGGHGLAAARQRQRRRSQHPQRRRRRRRGSVSVFVCRCLRRLRPCDAVCAKAQQQEQVIASYMHTHTQGTCAKTKTKKIKINRKRGLAYLTRFACHRCRRMAPHVLHNQTVHRRHENVVAFCTRHKQDDMMSATPARCMHKYRRDNCKHAYRTQLLRGPCISSGIIRSGIFSLPFSCPTTIPRASALRLNQSHWPQLHSPEHIHTHRSEWRVWVEETETRQALHNTSRTIAPTRANTTTQPRSRYHQNQPPQTVLVSPPVVATERCRAKKKEREAKTEGVGVGDAYIVFWLDALDECHVRDRHNHVIDAYTEHNNRLSVEFERAKFNMNA